MSDRDSDAGILQVVVEEFTNRRLPWLLGIKERVDQGERLSELDVTSLSVVLARANEVLPIVKRHPEYHELTAKAIDLYGEITEKAFNASGANVANIIFYAAVLPLGVYCLARSELEKKGDRRYKDIC